MRKLVISAVLVGTLASAAPAAAQYRGGYAQQGQGIERQISNLQQRVDQLFQRRLISTNEARRLSREIRQTDRLYDRFRRNGFTRSEQATIQNRIHNLRSELRQERQEGRRDRQDDRRDDRWDD